MMKKKIYNITLYIPSYEAETLEKALTAIHSVPIIARFERLLPDNKKLEVTCAGGHLNGILITANIWNTGFITSTPQAWMQPITVRKLIGTKFDLEDTAKSMIHYFYHIRFAQGDSEKIKVVIKTENDGKEE